MILTAAIVALAPLPFGGARGWAVSGIEVSVFVAVACFLTVEGGANALRSADRLVAPAAALVVLLLVQLVPLPPSAIDATSPAVGALYRDLLEGSAWRPSSVDPHRSTLALLRLAAYAGVFLITAFSPLPNRFRLLPWTILLTGGLTATIAWIHVLEGWTDELFGRFPARDPVLGLTRLHWPLVNPNHLAALLNLCWPVALGATFWPALLVWRERTAIGPRIARMLAGAVLALTLSALLATGSRGGFLAAGSGLLVLALAWPAGGQFARASAAVGQLAGLTALVVLASWIGWSAVQDTGGATELAALDRSDATLLVRLEAARQSLGLARDVWAFGSGLATWPEIFPRYQAYPLLFGFFPHLHGEYVEWACDTGLVGIALLAFFAVRFGGRALTGGGSRARERVVLVAAAATMLTHSVAEFAIRIPANALLFAFVLGALWRAATSADPALDDSGTARASSPIARGIFGLAAIPLCVLATSEWLDERALGTMARGAPIESPAQGSTQVFQRIAELRATRGLPCTDDALRGVEASPVSAGAHRILAFCYRSERMRERELRRAVACAPGDRALRLEHAVLLAVRLGIPTAEAEVEEAFRSGVAAGDLGILRYEDPASGGWPLLEAALRGARRRTREIPDAASDVAFLEGMKTNLEREQERRDPSGH